MIRCVGHKDGRITCVLESPHLLAGENTCPVPPSLAKLSDSTLLSDYRVEDGTIVPRTKKKAAKRQRVAMVSSWGEPCGIAAYSSFLFPELAKEVAELKVFSEWLRAESLTNLVKEIRIYNPDVVLIQHDYGLFPNNRHWLSFISQLQNYRTVVVFHNVYRSPGKAVVEAAIPEVIVHTAGAAQVLRDKQIPGKISIIPHGCLPWVDLNRLLDPYSSHHTLLQFGFGLRHKGWRSALHLVKALREDFPDLFYTGLFSMPSSASLHYEDQWSFLQAYIEDFNLQDHVSLIKGFQTEQSLNIYLRSNQVAIFPYTDLPVTSTPYACSGAARRAMHMGTPIVVSQVPLFEDLAGICPRAADVPDLINIVRDLLTDPIIRAEQVVRQNKFLLENSWSVTAERYAAVLGTG